MSDKYEIRKDRYYYIGDNIHLWVKPSGNVYRIGVDDMTRKLSRGVTFVYIKVREGAKVKRCEFIGTLESAKIVIKLVPPLTGTITKINHAVEEDASLVNEHPYDEGWLFEMTADNPKELEDLLKGEDAEKFFKEEEKRYG